MEASAIRLAAPQSTGAVFEPKSPAEDYANYLWGWDPVDAYGVGEGSPGTNQVFLRITDLRNANLHVEAEGIRYLAWHNFTASCSTEPCPSGGAFTSKTHHEPGGVSIHEYSWTVERFFPAGAHLEGDFSILQAAAGGSSLDLGVQGSLRLPSASWDPACETCINPANRTLWAEGNLRLAGIQPEGDGRLEATLSGDVASARLDEEHAEPAALFGVALVATATV
ncbi:MAG TPA: hypothetical protein VI796_02110, partial [Candidatus Thermoplasmatota archaeon]|nr:hypothetical protein [Candidatus Thermoplasmatota archaeon]